MSDKIFRIADIESEEYRSKAFIYARQNYANRNRSLYALSQLPLSIAFGWPATEEGNKFWSKVCNGKEKLAMTTLNLKNSLNELKDVGNAPAKAKPVDIEIDRHVTKRTICIAKVEGMSLNRLIEKLTVIPNDVADKTSNVRIVNDMIVCGYSERVLLKQKRFQYIRTRELIAMRQNVSGRRVSGSTNYRMIEKLLKKGVIAKDTTGMYQIL